MNKLKIIAVITAKEDCKQDILSALHNVVDGTRKEVGNISYDLYVDIQSPLVYIIIEEWESKEAIEIHNQTPHFLAFKNAIDGKIDNLTIDVIKNIY